MFKFNVPQVAWESAFKTPASLYRGAPFWSWNGDLQKEELLRQTGWHFDFNGHKRQGDWQAALGVLFRVHHLSWCCMSGEARRIATRANPFSILFASLLLNFGSGGVNPPGAALPLLNGFAYFVG